MTPSAHQNADDAARLRGMQDAPAPASPPLWQLLVQCARAVQAVESGRSLSDALAACPANLRPGVQALSFNVMRHLGVARATLQQLADRTPAPWVRALLHSALAALQTNSYAEHTLVNQTVQACKKQSPAAAGLVNAVLRRYLRERATLATALQTQPDAQWNHPAWWIRQVQQDWPEHWQALLHASNQPAPMVLRVNRRQHSPQTYQQLLDHQGMHSALVGEDGLVLSQPVPVTQLPGFDTGAVSVQDSHAQLAATLLLNAGLSPGARVLDACSAPGGKTAHLLERLDLDMLALDKDAQRLTLVNNTLGRLQLQAHTLAADAAATDTWWDNHPFDAILLDAPCSASGIVRRHPDVRWLRREDDITALAQTQLNLLERLWPLLHAQGVLLYCTCSVFKAEGQQVIDAFLQRTPGACLEESPGHLLPVVEYPGVQLAHPPGLANAVSGDGFFYALLRKTAAPN